MRGDTLSLLHWNHIWPMMISTPHLSSGGNARTRATFPTHKKSHNPHPQGERGKGVNMGTLHCGGVGGCLLNLDHIYIYIINTCIQNHTNHLSNKSDSSSKWPWPWPWSWCPLLTSASPHVVAQVPSQSGPVAVVLPPTPTAWGELVVGAENPLAVVFSTKNFGRFRNTYASCSKDYWKELEDFEQQDGEARKSRVVQVH